MSGRGHRPVRHGDLGRSPLGDGLPRAGDPDAIRRQHLLRVRGRSVAWIPPLLVLVTILLVDWYTGGEFRTVSWIVLVPGIAAAICGVRGTAVFAVLGLATYVLADHAWPRQYQTGLPDFILVGVGGALAVLACAVRVRGERRMLHMRDVAETTRRTLLRPLPPGWGGLDHAAVYLAADAVARVGGDFYDIQPGPHGTRALVGDVQGKGLGAVEAAAALLGTFREAGYHERELATVAARLETRIHRHGLHLAALDPEDDDRIDRFATAVLLSFPTAEPDTVEVVNFGHEPPLVVGPFGVRSLPPGRGLPLGLGELAHMDGPPPTLRIRLAPGETLLVVTDGVTEARDGAGVFYPLKSRVTEGVSADPRLAEPSRLVAYVRDGTLRHSGGHLADDTTIFAVRRL
ncbi:PP2C family protein-serine/threonine phosphatase [Streptomyces prunicolor]|uniref:PP2C family protein-serine/threonine phosphatase n=1 Tax=Streptomyces prunicolor TaxID=67348 RepID=UPI003866A430